MSLTKVTYSMISGAQVNVLDYGAVGDDSTDNLLFFKNALEYLQSVGGGALYIPSGTYCISKPIIVRSNIEVYGDGPASIIKNNNPAGYTPAGDCIHIGITNEWKDWAGGSGGITDANITQWDAGDYSYITTENVYIHDLKLTTDQPAGIEGQGIWVANSQNFVIENIWTDTVATPVSVGNDNPTSLAGSRNGVVKNIFQLVAGKWYDLVYLGECELIDVSNCFNNPESNATLNTGIAVGGNSRFCRVHDNVIRYQSAGSKIAIDISGPVVPNDWFNIVENNTIVAAATGITTYQKRNQIIKNNSFYGCDLGIKGYNTGQIFDGNVFYGNTADIYYESGCTSVTTNSSLTPSKISGSSAGDVSAQKFRNCIGYGGYKSKVFWPVDYVIGIGTETSNVNFHYSQITLAAPGTVHLWFRLPDNLLTANSLTTYWYANAAGEVLTQGLYKREAAANVGSFTQVGSTQTYTSSGSGDQTSTWSSINATVTNQQTNQPDQYYIQLTIAFASTSSQLRSSQFSYTTVGTLD